eukprot:5947088-Lingulodinium_polyedra.AAC.1
MSSLHTVRSQLKVFIECLGSPVDAWPGIAEFHVWCKYQEVLAHRQPEAPPIAKLASFREV